MNKREKLDQAWCCLSDSLSKRSKSAIINILSIEATRPEGLLNKHGHHPARLLGCGRKTINEILDFIDGNKRQGIGKF